jgi:hypothetical protein
MKLLTSRKEAIEMKRFIWVLLSLGLLGMLLMTGCYTVVAMRRVHRVEATDYIVEEEPYEDVVGEVDEEGGVVDDYYMYGDLWGYRYFDPFWSSPYWWHYSYSSPWYWGYYGYYDSWWDPWYYRGYSYGGYWRNPYYYYPWNYDAAWAYGSGYYGKYRRQPFGERETGGLTVRETGYSPTGAARGGTAGSVEKGASVALVTQGSSERREGGMSGTAVRKAETGTTGRSVTRRSGTTSRTASGTSKSGVRRISAPTKRSSSSSGSRGSAVRRSGSGSSGRTSGASRSGSSGSSGSVSRSSGSGSGSVSRSSGSSGSSGASRSSGSSSRGSTTRRK